MSSGASSNNTTWNIEYILILLSRSSLYITSPYFFRTLKGPSFVWSSFMLSRLVLIFLLNI